MASKAENTKSKKIVDSIKNQVTFREHEDAQLALIPVNVDHSPSGVDPLIDTLTPGINYNFTEDRNINSAHRDCGCGEKWAGG